MFNPFSTRRKIIGLAIVLFCTSCDSDITTNNGEKKSSGDTPMIAQAPGANLAVVQPKTFDGFLDTLYIERDAFLNLPKRRISLKYYINSVGRLTLHGWPSKTNLNNDEFDLDKQVELKSGNPSSKISFGAGSFLGGVILRQPEIETIKDSLRSRYKPDHKKYVIFAPAKDDLFSGHFIYNILLSGYEPAINKDTAQSVLSVKALQPTNVVAKPSPPRNS